MTAQQLFQIAGFGSVALPLAVAIALTLLPYPRRLFVRGVIAVLSLERYRFSMPVLFTTRWASLLRQRKWFMRLRCATTTIRLQFSC